MFLSLPLSYKVCHSVISASATLKLLLWYNSSAIMHFWKHERSERDNSNLSSVIQIDTYCHHGPGFSESQSYCERKESTLRVISLLITVSPFHVKWNNKLHVSSFPTCFRMSPLLHKAAHLIPPHALTRLAREWLAEDTPNFDPAGVCVGSQEVEARLLCKTPHSVLAGSPFFTAVFTEVGCTVDWIYQEGAEIGRHYTLSSKAPKY